MHFQRKEFVDKEREKLVKKYIIVITLATMCPAIYLTYGIVKSTIYEASANNFINKENDKSIYDSLYISNEKNDINLKYLYYDYFEKDEDNIKDIKDKLIKEIKNNWNKIVPEFRDHNTFYSHTGERQIIYNANERY